MVYHILKDGTTVSDVAGIVVKEEDAGAIYQLIHKISTEEYKNER